MPSLIYGYGLTGKSFQRYLNIKGEEFEIYDILHNDSLKIYQDVIIYAGKVNKGKSVEQTIDRDQAYVLCSEGKIKINDIEIKKGDGAEITDLKNVKITSLENSEILFIDLPR